MRSSNMVSSLWVYLRGIPRIFKSISFVFLMMSLFAFIILSINQYILWKYYISNETCEGKLNISDIWRVKQAALEEALRQDKGMVCEIPYLDPFNEEIIRFLRPVSQVVCNKNDWVHCYLSKCKVTPKILETIKMIECNYADIIFKNYKNYIITNYTAVSGDKSYILDTSDYVMVSCTGVHKISLQPHRWSGLKMGLRQNVAIKPPPPGREDSIDVLIFGFDATSKNNFIRCMPKSYDFIVNEMKATVLNGYNIVGDGTIAALSPFLSGKNYMEFPDYRRICNNNRTLNATEFIFYHMRQDGYRTGFLEDSYYSTFDYLRNGFNEIPADYFSMHYFKVYKQMILKKNAEEEMYRRKNKNCLGDTSKHQFMMNLTDQFFRLPGKHFCFTFISDLTHDDMNMIRAADDDTVNLLKTFRDEGRWEKTLIFIMGDHGNKFSVARQTYQGRLEERLPFMAIYLPKKLKDRRPNIQANLNLNVDVITTPHDIHTTILDALDLNQHRNLYKVRGSDLYRGLSLLDRIPRNRSCSEAGIVSHWCACLKWDNVSQEDPLYNRAGLALVDYINSLTRSVRDKCVPRTLTSITWMNRQKTKHVTIKPVKDNYQVQVTLGPGDGVYEASATYIYKTNKFVYDINDISRITAYKNEPSCIFETHPRLWKYCYCANHTVS